jgi:hypothetical protein
MQLTNKLQVAAPASAGVRAAVPVRVARRGVAVKAAAAATAPVVAENAVVDKCVNSIRFLAIGECSFAFSSSPARLSWPSSPPRAHSQSPGRCRRARGGRLY